MNESCSFLVNEIHVHVYAISYVIKEKFENTK